MKIVSSSRLPRIPFPRSRRDLFLHPLSPPLPLHRNISEHRCFSSRGGGRGTSGNHEERIKNSRERVHFSTFESESFCGPFQKNFQPLPMRFSKGKKKKKKNERAERPNALDVHDPRSRSKPRNLDRFLPRVAASNAFFHSLIFGSSDARGICGNRARFSKNPDLIKLIKLEIRNFASRRKLLVSTKLTGSEKRFPFEQAEWNVMIMVTDREKIGRCFLVFCTYASYARILIFTRNS